MLFRSALLVALFLQRGPTLLFAWQAAFALATLALVFIDYDHKILPDCITLPGIALGLAGSWLDPAVGWRDALLGASLGALLPLLLYTLWLFLRGIEGLGLGDVKMLAMIGAFLGWKGVLLTLVLGSITGAIAGLGLMVLRRRDFQSELPFGTFLGVAALAALLLGPRIIEALGRVVSEFERLHHFVPANFDPIVRSSLLPRIPIDPDGNPYRLDPQTGTVSSLKGIRFGASPLPEARSPEGSPR